MPTEYYLWQWADNDLAGHPHAVVAGLQAGDLPPAIQPFLIRRAYARLATVLDRHRAELSERVIEPAPNLPGGAHYIRLRLPLGDSSGLATHLLWAGWDAKLTVFNATARRLIGLPKRNVVESTGGRQWVDIAVADIPGRLHKLAAEPGLAALACYDRDGNMFQIWSHGGRFAVEWQLLPDRDLHRQRIWVAGRPTAELHRRRLGTLAHGLDLFATELLELGDVYQLWKAFLANSCPPSSHRWRDITRLLNRHEQPLRGRAAAPAVFGQN